MPNKKTNNLPTSSSLSSKNNIFKQNSFGKDGLSNSYSISSFLKSHILIIIPCSLVFLTTISFLVLSAVKVSADPNNSNTTTNTNTTNTNTNTNTNTTNTTNTVTSSNSSTASVTVSSACSMTSTVNTEHEATIPNGIYSGDSNYYPSGIGQTTLKTTCNDGNGFSIYAIGFTNDIEGENRLIGNNYSSSSNDSNSNDSNDSSSNSNDNNSNNNVIVTGTATSGTTSNWAMKVATDTSSTYPMTISSDSNGSFSSYHIVPSEYTKVAYRTSGTDVPTSSSSSSSSSSSTTATATGSILTTTYSAFISSTQVADTYHGKVKYVLVHPETNTKSLTLEDAFINAGKTKYNNTNYYAMQDMDSSICSSTILTGNDSAIKLIDIRDNQIYTVAKLKDGNCWMIDNLNLGDIDNYPLVADKLDYTNTNLPNDPAKEISATTFNGWKKTSGTGSYTNPEYIPVPGTDSTSQTIYGTLYNYCATSANTYCYEVGAGTGNTTADLCPAEWRLPTSGVNGEFYTLYDNYNSSSEMRAALSENGAAFAYAGRFKDSTAIEQGYNGTYWSSTIHNKDAMKALRLYLAIVYPSGDYYRFSGYSIRCLAK